jgi:hypothetical protein
MGPPSGLCHQTWRSGSFNEVKLPMFSSAYSGPTTFPRILLFSQRDSTDAQHGHMSIRQSHS